MSYRIAGIDPAPYRRFFGLPDDQLREHHVIRMIVNTPTFPCRVSLTDRAIGETVLLVNHVSHDVANPYRASHAIFVTEADLDPAEYIGAIPPVFEKRILSLRGFDSAGMMVDAVLAQPGQADAAICAMFDYPETAMIHAHNATRGCFSAKIERH